MSGELQIRLFFLANGTMLYCRFSYSYAIQDNDIGNPGGTYVRMELASVETALSAGIDTKTLVRGNISAMASFYTVIVGYEFPDGSRVEGSLYLGAVGNINRIESNHFQFAVAPAGWGGGIELILAPDE